MSAAGSSVYKTVDQSVFVNYRRPQKNIRDLFDFTKKYRVY